ncbi:hypothetical protein CLAIMM_05024 [Cladophialophora immunda]|nr:hypothetical protein CLAIMM_05024 [Cladophialophora immunda]
MEPKSETQEKPEIAKVEVEVSAADYGDGHGHGHAHTHHTQIGASHLYKEDAEGNVIGRVLIPRPTNDPNDPLTWAAWRKHIAFGTVCFYVLLSNFGLSAMTPGLTLVIEDFGIAPTQASYLVTLQILVLGVGNLFWIPLSLKIGKRPVMVISSGLFFVATIWSAVSKSYGSLLGSRIISGWCASASEAMGPAVVADLYFLHERATLTGTYTFMIGGGSALGGIFGGLVVNANSDWHWIFWMCAILTGVCFLLIVLFCAETNFIRPEDTEGLDNGQQELVTEMIRTKYHFGRSLKLWGWYDRETSLWLYFWRPLALLPYPAVFWASVCYGVTLGWVVFQLTANALYFPQLYHFSALGVGNLYAANVIGALLGCIYAGPCCDWLIANITKRHGGYFKPEYRLYLMIMPFLLGPLGLLLWGFGLQNQLHWSVAAAGSGISYAVLCAVPNIGMTYVVDSYRPVAGEAMTSLTAFKNTFAFGISFAVYPWLAKDGPGKVAGYQTLIEGVLFAFTIPLFVYGEKLRRWSSHFDV